MNPSRFFFPSTCRPILFALLLSFASSARAENSEGGGGTAPRAALEQRLFDSEWFPSKNERVFPGMGVSLDIARNMTHITHKALQSAGLGWAEKPLIVATDLATFFLPGYGAWMHEEWHRAILSRHGVASFNTTYETGQLKVARVSDAQLAHMKSRTNENFVRMAAAGIEGENELVLALQRDAFFRGNTTWDQGSLWLHRILPSFYFIVRCEKQDSEKARRENAIANVPVEKRDGIGADCLTWIYDLHRPHEEFAKRGEAPAGGWSASFTAIG